MLCPLRQPLPVPSFTGLLTSGKARLAPGVVLAQFLSKQATGQEGLPASLLPHTGCPLCTGASHGQPCQPILAAAPGLWGSILAHWWARRGWAGGRDQNLSPTDPRTTNACLENNQEADGMHHQVSTFSPWLPS